MSAKWSSVDFVTVATLQLRVLYVFVILTHDRRRVLHFNVTERPRSEWTAQQIIEAFPENPAPRYLARDRDGVYGSQFRTRVQGMGNSRGAHGSTESLAKLLCGTDYREYSPRMFEHVIVINQWHLRQIGKS
jgi:hypothetical protein